MKLPTSFVVVMCSVLASAVAAPGQPSESRTVFATQVAEALEWNARIQAMGGGHELRRVAVRPDTVAPGWRHERFQQQHRGVPVFGAQLVRHLRDSQVMAVNGKLYEGIVSDTFPAIAPGQAQVAAEGSEKPTDSRELVLINIYDHRTGPPSAEAVPDWGYSAFIRYRGKTILFDGGTSPVILERNAAALGVDLTEVDIVVLSHDHGDHTGGINHVVAVNPDVAIYVPHDWGFAAGDVDDEPKLRKGYRWPVDEYHPLAETTEITKGVHLIHTTSPLTGIFWKYPPHEKEPRLFELKELSLALETEGGDVVLVVGCSHSGVGEIVRATRGALNREIALVTGGFHLLPYKRDNVADLARAMRDDLGVKRVAATHCTGDEAVEVFEEVYGESFLWAGLGSRLTFPE